MSLYVVPALVALMLKLYILLIAHNSKSSRVFYGMILIFAIHNLCEVAAYIQFSEGIISEFLLRAYYAATFGFISYMCLYAIEVSKLNWLRRLSIPICAWMAVACLLVFFTDYLISGIQPMEHAVTAVPGAYYFLFSITALFSFLFVVGSLVRGYVSAPNHKVQVQCLYTLAAMSPIVLLGFIVIPLMSMGIEINAAGSLPICTTLFLIITLKSESKHGFSDVRRFLPFSRERKISNEVQD